MEKKKRGKDPLDWTVIGPDGQFVMRDGPGFGESEEDKEVMRQLGIDLDDLHDEEDEAGDAVEEDEEDEEISYDPERNSRTIANISPFSEYCNGQLYLLEVHERDQVRMSRLEGMFCEANGRRYFKVRSKLYRVKKILPALEGFTKYLIEMRRDVYLMCFPMDEKHIAVYDMRLGDMSPLGELGLYQPRFERFLKRLILSGGKTKAIGEQRAEFDTLSRMRFLINAGSGLFPDHIVTWAMQQFRIAEDSDGDRDLKRNARKALRYILNIDWHIEPPKVPAPKEVKKILDSEFYGLESVKERVMEIAAQLRRTKQMPKWGILLSGPPGVGKSTVALAIARIMGLPLVRLDMSTIVDSEGFVGSSRIYYNGRPGAFVERLRAAGTANVVVCINELDKNNGTKGSPSDALLTMLDGLGFTDEFIETWIPTDGMFFIATANDVKNVSPPLLDRFLQIEIPAYSTGEKEVILRDHILPRMMKRYGLGDDEFTMDREAMSMMCDEYANEPGVRDLEKYCEKIISHGMLVMAKSRRKRYHCGKEELVKLIGPSKRIERQFSCQPGLVRTAFLYEGAARDIPVEAVILPGTGKFRTIGISDETVRAHCEAAWFCLCASNPQFDAAKNDVAVYVPQTIPGGDDNFIGIAAYAAMYSAIAGVEYPKDVAFLGGCDIRANTFMSVADITPHLARLAAYGVRTVYAPLGAGKLVHGRDCGIRVLESDDVDTLVKMATYDHNLGEAKAG